MKRLPIIGVIGSHTDSHQELAKPLGQLIAEKHCHLLTGGGDGIMTAVAKSYTSVPARKGLCIGILPIEDRSELTKMPHYTNPYIEIPIVTQLDLHASMGSKTPLAHNSVNILSSDIIIVLPGLKGTQSETSLALVCHKPVMLFGHVEDFKEFPSEPILAETIGEVEAFMDHTIEKRQQKYA